MDKILIDYLGHQMISKDVATSKGIRFENDKIVIPVFDIDNKFLFNKYRKSPLNNDKTVPKYTYDKGSTSSLYNVHTLKDKDTVFITEGEMKALCLESYGFTAVSTTGGAGAFKEEWVELFKEKKVYIVYDNDEAGVKGAFMVQQKIPRAQICFLPQGKYGKDVNDFMRSGQNFYNVIDKSICVFCPMLLDFQTKREMRLHYNEVARYAKSLDEMYRKSKGLDGESPLYWIPIIHDMLLVHLQRLKQIDNRWNIRKGQEVKYKDDFLKAKNVPISNIIKFNHQGFARSVWNPNDKNPSMKYYPKDNRVYDYSTGRGGDVIDVGMAIWGLTFKQTIDKLIR